MSLRHTANDIGLSPNGKALDSDSSIVGVRVPQAQSFIPRMIARDFLHYRTICFGAKQIAMMADEKSPSRISHRRFATSCSEMRVIMIYTVGEMAKMLDVPASTLRYYDKEGLLPFVERSPGGIRMFQESDYGWLKIISCLKKAGMPLKDIREYINLALQGDETIEQRLELFYKQREILRAQMAELQETLDTLDYKCWYYETAKEAGSTHAPETMPLEKIPSKYRKTRKRLHNED